MSSREQEAVIEAERNSQSGSNGGGDGDGNSDATGAKRTTRAAVAVRTAMSIVTAAAAMMKTMVATVPARGTNNNQLNRGKKCGSKGDGGSETVTMMATVVAEVAVAATATAMATAMEAEAEAEVAVRCGGRGWCGWVGAAAGAHLNRCRWDEGMKTRGQKFCQWT